MTVPACDPDLLARTVAATRTAAAIALAGFKRDDLLIDDKADGTPVTQFDRAVERSLRDHVAAHHPGDAFLGEEGGEAEGTTGRRWIIDPIDGTSPFSKGIVTWSTLVALDDEHGPLLGVVACPWVDEVVWAGRGLGCTWDGAVARASDRTDLRGAVVSTSGIEWWSDGVLGRLHAAGVEVKTWGNGYGLALAATGRIDAFFDDGVKPWDLGPAPVLMAEAGGRFSALDGSSARDRGNGLLAGPGLHDRLLDLIRG